MNKINEQVFIITKGVVDSIHHSRFTKDSMLFEESILDSLGLMQLLTEIEKEFSIAINTEDLTIQNFASVNHITSLVESYLKEK